MNAWVTSSPKLIHFFLSLIRQKGFLGFKFAFYGPFAVWDVWRGKWVQRRICEKTYTSQPWSTIKKQFIMMFVCKEVRFEENYIDNKTRRTILWSATMAWCIIQWKVLVQNRTSKQHQMLHHTFILNYLQSQAFSLWSLASTGIPIILSGFAMSQRRRIAGSVSCKGSDED